jgi:galactose mutarotase-like enzyme
VSTEPVRLSTEWALAGQPAVVCENRRLRVVVLPGLGGKIISLVDKTADTELLWRNPRVPLRPAAPGAAYDDQFLGGWDELFPNDEPEELAGEPMPDHGELWTQPWAVTTGGDPGQCWVELTLRPPISATSVTKRLTLGAGSEVRLDYRVTNEGRRDLPYLWKSHVAVALQPDSRVDMAADTVLVHEFGEPRGRPADPLITWPTLPADGVEHDLRRMPDIRERGVSEFLLATRMHAGACSVSHPAAGTGLRLHWDLADLPSCWLFASYGGGWRGLDVLVLEPCSGFPLSVAEGVAAGTHRILPAGATISWSLRAGVGGADGPVER